MKFFRWTFAVIVLVFFSLIPAQALPDLVPAEFLVPAILSDSPHPELTLVWKATNPSQDGTNGNWYDGIYLSTNGVLDDNAVVVDQVSAPTQLNAEGYYWRTNKTILPIETSGTYHLFLKLDVFGQVTEASESNNIVQKTFTFKPTPPDLVPVEMIVPAQVDPRAQPTVSLAWRVTNQGTGIARRNWTDLVYLSPDTKLDTEDQYVGTLVNWGPLTPGESVWRTNAVMLPIAESGKYYLLLQANAQNWLLESETNNNLLAVPITVAIQAPDLMPVVVQVPAQIVAPPNSTVTLAWGVTNQGTGQASGNRLNEVFLSEDPTLNNGDQSVLTSFDNWDLAAGHVLLWTNSVRLPVVSSGRYYLIFRVNSNGGLYEPNQSNNVVVVPLQFTAQPSDLAVMSAVVPAELNCPPNPQVTYAFGVTNQGSGAALNNWVDCVYFSLDAQLDPQDTRLNTYYRNGPIAPGETYLATNTTRVPATQSGVYYLIFQTDRDNRLAEVNQSNNWKAMAVRFNIQPPDLQVTLKGPDSVVGPPDPTITFVWGVSNAGPGFAAACPFWEDRVYFSTDTNLDWSDPIISSDREVGPMAPGECYWHTNSATVPVHTNGTYYLILVADVGRGLAESDESNNQTIQAIRFNVLSPDLKPLSSSVPVRVTAPPYPLLDLVWGTTNQGTGPAETHSYWMNVLWFSTNSVLDANDTWLEQAYETGPTPAGQFHWRTNQLRLPVTQSGTYYIIVELNWRHLIYEDDYINNLGVVPVVVTVEPPDLKPMDLQAPSLVTAPPNPRITFSWAITNQGLGAAIANNYWNDQLYLSTDATLDNRDVPLRTDPKFGLVNAGTGYDLTNTVQVPVVQSGDYYLILQADADEQLFESNETNNTVAVPIRFEVQRPDLQPVILQVAKSFTGAPNPSFTFVWGVTNQGTGAALAGNPGYLAWADKIYISTNCQLDSTATPILTLDEYGPLNSGAAYWRTNILQLPVVQSGTYYLFLVTDADRSLIETDYSNNVYVTSTVLNLLPPDLAPLLSLVPTNIVSPPLPNIAVTWGITNQGTGPAVPSWTDRVFISTDSVWDWWDKGLTQVSHWQGLDAGESYWTTSHIELPVTQSGTQYLIFQADAGNALYETDQNNNVEIVPVTFTILPPDLAPITFKAPRTVTGPPNPSMTLVWGVTNQGTGAARRPGWAWTDMVSISTNPILDYRARSIQSSHEPNGAISEVEPGGSYWRTNTVRVPMTESGTYYLFFEANSTRDVFEENYSNNVAVVPITFVAQPPDLVPLALNAPAVVTGSPNPILQLSWAVTNQGVGPAIGFPEWTDRLYLSTNAFWNEQAVYLSEHRETGPTFVGDSYSRSKAVRLPVVKSGSYYLQLRVNSSSELVESDYTNNSLSIPIQFNVQPPDLAPALEAPRRVTGPPQPAILLSWGVTNQGIGPAVPYPYWSDTIWLSSEPELDWRASVLCHREETQLLEPGDSYHRQQVARLPVFQSGTYYIIFQGDATRYLYESDETNNVVVVPIEVEVQAPDLMPLELRLPTVVNGPPHPTIDVTWGVTNRSTGSAVAIGSWGDALFFSTKPFLDGSQVGVAFRSEPGPLSPGSSYWRAQSVRLPIETNGTYYLHFRVNDNQALSETNYDNNALIVPITAKVQPPDLAPIALQTPATVIGPVGTEVTIVWGVTNQGIGTAIGNSHWADRLWISTNAVDDYSSALMYLDLWESGPAAPGGSYWWTNRVSLPFTESGTYYIHVEANGDRSLLESVYTNNVLVAPIHYTRIDPDLVPLALQVPPIVTGPPNPTVTVVWGMTNQGNGWAEAGRRDVLSISGPRPEAPSRFVAAWISSTQLSSGGVYWQTNQVRLPIHTSGTYQLTLVANVNRLDESNTSNNLTEATFTYQTLLPDLAPVAFQVPASVSLPPSSLLSVVWGVTNLGSGPATSPGSSPASRPGWHDVVFLSTSASSNSSPLRTYSWAETNTVIPAGGSYWRTNSLRLPELTNGVYYLTFQTDGYRSLYDSNPSNNSVVVPIEINLLPAPNLKPLALINPMTITSAPNPVVTLVWGATNDSTSPAELNLPWPDEIYLSRTGMRDGSEQRVGIWWGTNYVEAGGSYWSTNVVRLPITDSGKYFLIFSANAFNYVYESNTNDNELVVPFTFEAQPSDLAPISLLVADQITGAPYPEVTVVVGITNQGIGTAIGSPGWQEALFISGLPLHDPSAVLVKKWLTTNSVASGDSYWLTNNVRLPVVDSGTYYLIFETGESTSLAESDPLNNTAVAPITFTRTALSELRLESPQLLSNGAFRVGVNAAPGIEYVLQVSGDLVNWVDVQAFLSTGSLTWVSDPQGWRYTPRFYRVVPR
ncbi:MAG TPA: CARDB domain-containing protein [Clostridia bacterium]|nr:CARDB domain-containing protein [Clostridia bacterium]